MNLSNNTQNNDVRTFGYVLRRTNYGEADRILNLITPQGKFSVIAKGVRKAKSKLSGGIEMFTLADFNIHLGRGDFGILTGAKMMQYYGNIIKDFGRMELAGMILKKISQAAENSDNPEYFKIVDESLKGLNDGEKTELVEAWFLINLAKATGEDVNLYRDVEGKKLEADKLYIWDGYEAAFCEKANGEYGANEIKMLRLMLTNNLGVVRRVNMDNAMYGLVLKVARAVAKI